MTILLGHDRIASGLVKTKDFIRYIEEPNQIHKENKETNYELSIGKSKTVQKVIS